jgi:hypothetical protein
MRRINRSEGTNFDGDQCKRKFQNLVSAYYVSIIIIYKVEFGKQSLIDLIALIFLEYVLVFSWGRIRKT